MRVAIADDSALFRQGLELMLAASGLEVVASVADGGRLLAAVASSAPDVVVLDIRMPPTFTDEGLQAAVGVRAARPGTGVLLLSTYAETSYAMRLMENGTQGVGYLLKDRVDDVATLTDTLQRLTRGESVVDSAIVTRLLTGGRRERQLESLSTRELDVLRLMAEGRSNAGIGSALFLSPRTVETHVNAVFTKLDLLSDPESNRRVLAVLRWFRAQGDA